VSIGLVCSASLFFNNNRNPSFIDTWHTASTMGNNKHEENKHTDVYVYQLYSQRQAMSVLKWSTPAGLVHDSMMSWDIRLWSVFFVFLFVVFSLTSTFDGC
ncbi:mCG142513, isoform CRA_c, partial [Mus musculus]